MWIKYFLAIFGYMPENEEIAEYKVRKHIQDNDIDSLTQLHEILTDWHMLDEKTEDFQKNC